MSWLIEHLGVGLKYLQKVYKWKEYNIKSQYKAKSKTLSLKKNNYNNQKRREQHEIKENQQPTHQKGAGNSRSITTQCWNSESLLL